MGLLFLRFIAIVTTPGARWETADWSFDLIQEIADAEREAELRRLEAEKERVKLTAEAEAEKLRLALQSQVDEARALAEHPELVRLKQLETLKEMARSGAKFVWGVDRDPLHGAFGDEEPPLGSSK